MKFYIGLGGIGCKTLVRYHKLHVQDLDKQFYYVNTEPVIGDIAKNVYIMPNAVDGTGTRRYAGRNMVNYEIYNGLMTDFFSEIKHEEQVELIFTLSSFGGFGGAAIIPLIDYLEAITWNQLQSCVVISFNESALLKWGFPEKTVHEFQENTIEYVNELLSREQEANSRYYTVDRFNPGCVSYLVDTKDIDVDKFWECFDYPDYWLKEIDCKERYKLRQSAEPKDKPDVFISYSFKDQEIADKIVEQLKISGYKPWIATQNIKEGSYAKQIVQAIREAKVFLVVISKNSINSEQVKNEIDRAFNRIKDGMVIIPFIIDDSEMDDECEYYLCRQEKFFGITPPIDDRIQELINCIREVLER